MSEGSCWRALGFFVRSTVSIHFVIHFIPFPFWLNVRLRVSLSLASFSRIFIAKQRTKRTSEPANQRPGEAANRRTPQDASLTLVGANGETLRVLKKPYNNINQQQWV